MGRPPKFNKAKLSKILIDENVANHARDFVSSKFNGKELPWYVEELLVNELIKDGRFADGLEARAASTAVTDDQQTAKKTAEIAANATLSSSRTGTEERSPRGDSDVVEKAARKRIGKKHAPKRDHAATPKTG